MKLKKLIWGFFKWVFKLLFKILVVVLWGVLRLAEVFLIHFNKWLKERIDSH